LLYLEKVCAVSSDSRVSAERVALVEGSGGVGGDSGGVVRSVGDGGGGCDVRLDDGGCDVRLDDRGGGVRDRGGGVRHSGGGVADGGGGVQPEAGLGLRGGDRHAHHGGENEQLQQGTGLRIMNDCPRARENRGILYTVTLAPSSGNNPN